VSPSTNEPSGPEFRVAFVPGVTVRKWTTRWAERHPEIPLSVTPVESTDGVAVLHSGAVDVSFVRLPIDREGLSVIRLYGEVPVLVVSRDSALASQESVSLADAADAVSSPVAGNVKDAFELVAAGVGTLRLPHSLARLHARKDVVAIPISDAPETEIAIAWLAESTTDSIEEFVGIVRGRTADSSRGTPTPPTIRPKQVVEPKVWPKRPQRRKLRQGGKRTGR
jgi:DNA-binding transcriptional LysR family regulator